MAGEAGYLASGAAPRIKDIHAVALYDTKGRIHHMHHVVMLEGGRTVDAETAISEAKLHAERMGRDVRKLKALHVTRVPNPRGMHRVDVKKQVLVELEPSKSLLARLAGAKRRRQ